MSSINNFTLNLAPCIASILNHANFNRMVLKTNIINYVCCAILLMFMIEYSLYSQSMTLVLRVDQHLLLLADSNIF